MDDFQKHDKLVVSQDSNLDNASIQVENLENEVDAKDVDMSSFKDNDVLDPKFWFDGGKVLDSKIRLKLLDIADAFWDSLNIDFVSPKDIILTGSICNYNWSKYSDVDLHIVVDFLDVDDNTDLVYDYFMAKKSCWNEEHKRLNIYGHKVELYVQDVSDDLVSSGVYSLEKNKWIKEPSKNKTFCEKADKVKIRELASSIMTDIDNLVDEYESTKDEHEIEDIGRRARRLFYRIRRARKDSISNYGESGVGNIIFKVLRRTKYLEKLYDLRIAAFDKVNSLR